MSHTPKRETVEIVVIVIAFLIAIPLVFVSLPKKGDIIRYDCSLAEISPDFPLEVREQCRKLRSTSLTST
jgi:hypothetical protein